MLVESVTHATQIADLNRRPLECVASDTCLSKSRFREKDAVIR